MVGLKEYAEKGKMEASYQLNTDYGRIESLAQEILYWWSLEL